jgi:hypothetical protein
MLVKDAVFPRMVAAICGVIGDIRIQNYLFTHSGTSNAGMRLCPQMHGPECLVNSFGWVMLTCKCQIDERARKMTEIQVMLYF